MGKHRDGRLIAGPVDLNALGGVDFTDVRDVRKDLIVDRRWDIGYGVDR